MFPEPEKRVMRDFRCDVAIENDEVDAAHDRPIRCAVEAIKPVLSIHAR
jgi:hypothetical protein